MHSLSHFIARLRRASGTVAAALVLVALGAAPAHAATIAGSKGTKAGKDMVSASDVDSVVAYLASKGDTVTRGESDSDDPMLDESNNYYKVFFYCNDDHKTCDAIQFRACYSDYPEANLDKINALSRDYFFAKSYIDSDNNACIELPVATGTKGISYAAMDIAYEAFTGFTQSADDYFGTRTE